MARLAFRHHRFATRTCQGNPTFLANVSWRVGEVQAMMIVIIIKMFIINLCHYDYDGYDKDYI